MITDKNYLDGVYEATEPMTHEEAIKCGFDQPYSAVNSGSPTQKLLALRLKRLVTKYIEERLIK